MTSFCKTPLRLAAIFISLAVGLSLPACKLSDESKLKKAWHNLLARDNIWFNANERLKTSVLNLRNQHEDAYDKVLNVFPYGTETQRKALASEMDEIIKKCSKVLVKYPISKWVDDCYLILGKAQFFKGDAYAAVETFQTLTSKFKTSPLKDEATLWIIQSYVYMNKPAEAEAIVGLVQTDNSLPEKWLDDLAAMSADIKIRQEKYQPAIEPMKLALKGASARWKKARYTYILGQLYQKTGQYDSANYYFRRVNKYNPPYDMAFNARMNLAKSYNAGNKSQAREVKRFLRRMLKDDKNISFYDQIYYELAQIALKEKNIPEAIKLFKLSAAGSQTNLNQKALTYQTLADVYFNLPRPDYKNAQAYYDSTAMIIPKENPDYARIQEKKEVLNELIGNLLTIQEQDSLLTLAALPLSKLDKVLDKAIEDNKTKKEEPTPDNTPVVPGQPNPSKNTTNSSWVFSNPTLLALGQAEFLKKWGNRKNVDYWRIASKASEMQNGPTDPEASEKEAEQSDSAAEAALKDNPLMKNASADKKAILMKIPFSDAQKKAAENKIAKALTENGSIYFEKLGDKEEALNSLNKVTLEYPAYSGMDKVLYLQYKIKKESGEEAEASRLRARLIEKYPKSEYTKILTRGEKKISSTSVSPESRWYDSAYATFLNKQYVTSRALTIEGLKKFAGGEYQPRFDLLAAMLSGYLDSVSQYENQLKLFVSRYPNTDESEKANRLLEAVGRIKQGNDPTKEEKVVETQKEEQKLVQQGNYKPGFSSRYFYVLMIPTTMGNVEELKNSLSDHNRIKHGFEGLEIRVLQFNQEYQLLRVNEFKDKAAVKVYVDELLQLETVKKTGGQTKPIHFGISEENFLQLFNSKDINGYLNFYQGF